MEVQRFQKLAPRGISLVYGSGAGTPQAKNKHLVIADDTGREAGNNAVDVRPADHALRSCRLREAKPLVGHADQRLGTPSGR